MSRRALAKVRPALRTVSRRGHSLDVGVADGDDPVGAGRRRRGEHLPEDGAGVGGGGGDVVGVEDVEHAFEGPQDAVASGVAAVEGAHQPVEGDDVGLEPDDRTVDDGEIGPPEAVERPGPGGGGVAEEGRGEAVVGVHVGVGRRLDEEADRPDPRASPARAGGHRGRSPGRDGVEGDVQGTRRHPLDGRTGEGEGEALGLEPGPGRVEAEVDDGLGPGGVPAGRDRPAQPPPHRPPGRAPLLADGGRAVGGGEGLAHGHRFAGDVPALDAERHRGSVAGRGDPVVEGARDAVLDDHPVVVHACVLPYADGPKRSTRTAPASRPPATTSPAAASANPEGPHT
jgi:hypothetical protein